MEKTLEMVIYFNKNLGETPLECLNRFKAESPAYAGLTATYAGRLDPAAEGQMLFLFGDLVHQKDAYLKHSKIYTATFTLGVSTDTGDLLGLPTAFGASTARDPDHSVAIVDEEKIKKVVAEIKNLTEQTYPAYSSRPVDGKPLFAHAREGNSVERPIRPVEIFSCDLLDLKMLGQEVLIERVEKICNLVTGDFRQQDILAAWKEKTRLLPQEIPTVTLSLHVGSGTYIRGLADIFEKVLGVPTVLFSLTREKIVNDIRTQ